jgi:hypothetical protein
MAEKRIFAGFRAWPKTLRDFAFSDAGEFSGSVRDDR